MNIRTTAKAESRYAELAKYFLRENSSVALSFIDAYDHTCKNLERFPEMGHRLRDFHDDFRSVRIGTFSHLKLIYSYSETDQTITILWIFDVRQNPTFQTYL